VRDFNEHFLTNLGRELRRVTPVDPSFDARVMNAVRALPRHAGRTRWRRFMRPRTLTVSPLTWGLLAASLVGLVSYSGWHAYGDFRAVEPDARPVAALFTKSAPVAPHRVQFVLVAPSARKVAVVGDFNGWDANHASYQAVHRGGGVWSVTAPVPVGHHRYSFVVDDSVWVADPTAPRVLDSDYGLPNSALLVSNEKQ
jgi:hypothetical protein